MNLTIFTKYNHLQCFFNLAINNMSPLEASSSFLTLKSIIMVTLKKSQLTPSYSGCNQYHHHHQSVSFQFLCQIGRCNVIILDKSERQIRIWCMLCNFTLIHLLCVMQENVCICVVLSLSNNQFHLHQNFQWKKINFSVTLENVCAKISQFS